MPGLKLVDIHKAFKETRAVNGVSFEVAGGEVVAYWAPAVVGNLPSLR